MVDGPLSLDVSSNEGLRAALGRVPAEGGWSGPTGTLVLAALPNKLRHAAPRRAQRAGRSTSPEDLSDLVSRAFEILTGEPDRVRAAKAPWAYLCTAASNAAVRADMMLDYGVPEWLTHEGRRTPLPPRPTRLGATATDMERVAATPVIANVDNARAGMHHEDDFGEVMSMVLAAIVARGAPEDVTTAALLRCTQIIATTGASRRHKTARCDLELVLTGLSAPQARDLMVLLVGEQGGRDADDTLLAAAREAIASGRPLELSRVVRRRLIAFAAGFSGDGARSYNDDVPTPRNDETPHAGGVYVLANGQCSVQDDSSSA